MKTYLLILNGPEKRDFTVERAINVSIPAFDEIRVLQNGYLENHSNPLIEKYTTHSFSDSIDMVKAHELLVEDLQDGDYFLALDSDECPDPELLNFIKRKEFDPRYTHYGIQYKHHQIDNNGLFTYVVDSKEAFRAVRFHRYEDSMVVKTYFGSHTTYSHDDSSKYLPSNLHINHFKHDFAMLLSTIAHVITYPESNGITGGLEHDTIVKIRSKYDAKLSFIYKNFTNKSLFKEIRELLQPVSNSEVKVVIDIFRAIDFILANDKDLLELNRYQSCELECCTYA